MIVALINPHHKTITSLPVLSRKRSDILHRAMRGEDAGMYPT